MSAESRLRAKIARAPSLAEAAILEVDLAVYMVRTGRSDEALEIYRKYHDSGEFGANLELSLNLMLLDGLRSYYINEDFDISIDRLNRALRLGESAGLKRFGARVNAWISHIYFNSCKYPQMTASLRQALSLITEEDGDSLVRLSLTLGDAYALCGDFNAANIWYEYSRNQAIAIEDRVSVAAVMHNRATMALAHCRFSKACLGSPSGDAASFLLEVGSAASFESYIGMGNVLYPFSIWMGRLKMYEEKYFEALDIFSAAFKADEFLGKSAVLPSALCDLAYCMLQIGRKVEALELLTRVHDSDLNELYKDDLAVLYSYSAAILDEVSDDPRREDFLRLAAEARKEFLQESLLLRSELAQVVEFRPLIDNWPIPNY